MSAKISSIILLINSILICVLTYLFVLFNVPIYRQVFGFLFLMILPGYLILKVLDINLDFLTELLLSWGLSVSFVLLIGLALNSSMLSIGYEKPLSSASILISFSILYILLATVHYVISLNKSKDKISALNINNLLDNWKISLHKYTSNLDLTSSEKAFLILPIILPSLSILGMHLMNTNANNIVIILMLTIVSIYVLLVCIFNNYYSNRLYPISIFSISLSLILLLPLRSNHLIGIDTHIEYYFFQTTLNNLYWEAFANSTLDSSLSISLLPTIFQSVFNIPSEILFKLLYPIIFSISPLIVFVISRKYINDSYAFLASCFYMFQWIFIWTEYNSRTSVAILFFALTIMVLFNNNIGDATKKLLMIIFMASCIMSHYSTTYIFFFIIFGVFIGSNLLSLKYNVDKYFNLNMLLIFFALIFIWYSLITEKAFFSGINFIKSTFVNLENFFVEDSRDTPVMSVMGKGIFQKGYPHIIEFIFTWLSFAFTGMGIFAMLKNPKKFTFPKLSLDKSKFLIKKFEVTYALIAIICAGLLVTMLALPYVSKGYGMQRLYALVNIILSLFFIMGAIQISKYIKIKPYILILLVLLPYLFCVTGVTYNLFDVQRSILINSEGEQYDFYYVHDYESASAKWLKENSISNATVYTDFYGKYILMSQATYPLDLINNYALINRQQTSGYIFLKYSNVMTNSLSNRNRDSYNLTEFSQFTKFNMVYNNDYSEIYK